MMGADLMAEEVAATLPVVRHNKIEISGGSRSVLVVDDDEDVRRYVARVVRSLGLLVVEAEDLRAAAGVVDTLNLCIVFLDKCLPDGDGVEFSRLVLSRLEGVP